MAVLQDEYSVGLAAFRSLAHPTPLDLRWAGVCLTHEGQYPEAELRLRQAVAGGELGATIHLSALLLLNGDVSGALTTLQGLDPGLLPSEDAALWYRERGRVAWLLGDHRDTLFKLGMLSWQAASGASERTQVAVATFTGQLYGHFGEHERALAYLDFAVENGRPRQREYVALCRAGSLIALRRFDEAQIELARIQSVTVMPLRDLERGLLLRTQQAWGAARSTLTAVLANASASAWVRFQAHLDLLALCMAEGDDAHAQFHLVRAEALVHDTYDQFLLDYRAGQWLIRQNDPLGIVRLQRAAQGLEQAGHLTGAAAARLALAEAQPEQRWQHVHHAATLAAHLGTPPLLTPEWPLLPQTYQSLISLPDATFERLILLGEATPPQLQLLTLGQSSLVSPEGQIGFRLGRVVEFLCYLLRHRTATLRQIQRDLFPDDPAQRAKNYFHQVRVDVAARVPGLEIYYDPAHKHYRLQGRTTVVWDVKELEEALGQGEWPRNAPRSIEFLPSSESEWAEKERVRLSRWVTQVGLETMEGWFQSGEYEKCIHLAERLLPLDPLDEGLHSFLLNATYHAKGHQAARHLYRESAASFVREVGEIPDALRRLGLQWQAIN